MQSPTLNAAGLPVCSVCGEPITDIQDIEYDVAIDGTFGNVRHTSEYHREIALAHGAYCFCGLCCEVIRP